MTAPEPYPEHQRLKAIRPKSQAIGEFLDWLATQELTICRIDNNDRYYPCHKPIQQYLSEFFDIDLEVLEDEKQQMLKVVRNEPQDQERTT